MTWDKIESPTVERSIPDGSLGNSAELSDANVVSNTFTPKHLTFAGKARKRSASHLTNPDYLGALPK